MAEPRILTVAAEARELAAAWRREGRRVALVPTMGYLHEGHLSLMREALRLADRLAVSVFVNPLQFGPAEDLSRYPRDLEGDLAKCAAAGAHAVFNPPPEQMYPEGFQTSVEVTELSQGLCGTSRPDHFRGVATVVAKLLCLFWPDVAVFGRKDYQQLKIVERLALDLGLPTRIVGAPIVREPDGLALSSRNAYLSADERRRALCLSQGLGAARALFATGLRDPAALTQVILDRLAAAQARADYAEVRDGETLRPVAQADERSMAFVAAFVGKTRLIDNAALA
ncbi:MAG: pantoate--beta-alanine ligase [Myxococcales bacterium]